MKNKCYWCGEILTEDEESDHYLPKSSGGFDHTTNRIRSCKSCNREKGCNLWIKYDGKIIKLKRKMKRHLLFRDDNSQYLILVGYVYSAKKYPYQKEFRRKEIEIEYQYGDKSNELIEETFKKLIKDQL